MNMKMYRSEAEYRVDGKALLLSDIHITATHSERERALEAFIAQHVPGTERLFILGDLFDFWIGRAQIKEEGFSRVIEMLREVVRSGTGLTLLRGNRDVYLGREITRATGADVFGDGLTLQTPSQRIYLCHGDTFCTHDLGYLRFRALLRSWPVATLYARLPGWVARYLADGYKKTARRTADNKEVAKTSIVLDAVEAVLAQGYDAVVCGHVHTPRQVTVTGNGHDKKIIILGDWSNKGWYAEAENNRLELIRFG